MSLLVHRIELCMCSHKEAKTVGNSLPGLLGTAERGHYWWWGGGGERLCSLN